MFILGKRQKCPGIRALLNAEALYMYESCTNKLCMKITCANESCMYTEKHWKNLDRRTNCHDDVYARESYLRDLPCSQ